MFCNNCGNKLVENAMFCKFCGEPVGRNADDKTELIEDKTEFIDNKTQILYDGGNKIQPSSNAALSGQNKGETLLLNGDGNKTEIISYGSNATSTSAGNGTFATTIKSAGPVELKYREHFLDISKVKMTQFSGKNESGVGLGNALLLILLVLAIIGSIIICVYILKRPVFDINTSGNLIMDLLRLKA